MSYSYCNSEDCIHECGCRRFIGNYTEKIQSSFWIKPLDCINSKPWRFEHLDRFRLITGEDFDACLLCSKDSLTCDGKVYHDESIDEMTCDVFEMCKIKRRRTGDKNEH